MTLPLGFDFARLAYRHVFAGAARAFGIPAGWIAANASVFEHLLAHLNGRVYYRLDNARRVTSKVLTSVASQRAWQDFLGLASLPWPITRPGMGARVRAVGRLTRLALGYRRNNRRLAAAFQSELHGLRAFVDSIDGQETATIWSFFETRAAALFAAWAPTIVNDYFAMKFHDLLRRQLDRLCGAGAGLGNDLLCGIEGLPSEGPILALLAMKRRIKEDTVLQDLFARPAAEVAARLADGDAAVPDDFRQAWTDYLREFGDRTLEELKLERPTLRMRPDLLASMVQNQLANPHDADTMRKRQRVIRSAAERRLAGALSNRPVRRWIIGLLLARARQAVRDREAMRINRARAFGAVKEMFHALGRRMQAQGLFGPRGGCVHAAPGRAARLRQPWRPQRPPRPGDGASARGGRAGRLLRHARSPDLPAGGRNPICAITPWPAAGRRGTASCAWAWACRAGWWRPRPWCWTPLNSANASTARSWSPA